MFPDAGEMEDQGVTLAVLAGGDGSRMGGAKGLLWMEGRPILGHLMERLAWEGPTLLVTSPGREKPPGWDLFGGEAVDPEAGLGPLRGVLTALESVQTELLVVTTVDMPMVMRGQLKYLAQQLAEHPEWLGVMVERQDGGSARVEPFPCAFRAMAQAMVAEELASGRRSVQALSRQERVGVVAEGAGWPEEVWTNLNTPEDAGRVGARMGPPEEGENDAGVGRGG